MQVSKTGKQISDEFEFGPWPEIIKKFLLKSAKHEIFTASKC